MAKFEVTYTGTDRTPQTIEAHDYKLHEDDYEFTNIEGTVVTRIPRERVLKIQKIAD